MSAQTIKILIAGVLLVHGLGHIGAFMAIFFTWSRGTGGWLPARSWLFPSLSANTARMIASVFWILSMIGFVAAAASFWGVLLPGDLWRMLAMISAVVSMVGIVSFLGNWPAFNTIAALGVNAAVLVALLWLSWPPQVMFGK